MNRILIIGLAMAATNLSWAAESRTVDTQNRALLDQYCVTCHNEAVVSGTGVHSGA